MLVKGTMYKEKVNDGMPHGANVLLEVISPQIIINDIVFGDINFSSIAAAELLRMSGLQFISVVKTVTKNFQ